MKLGFGLQIVIRLIPYKDSNSVPEILRQSTALVLHIPAFSCGAILAIGQSREGKTIAGEFQFQSRNSAVTVPQNKQGTYSSFYGTS